MRINQDFSLFFVLFLTNSVCGHKETSVTGHISSLVLFGYMCTHSQECLNVVIVERAQHESPAATQSDGGDEACARSSLPRGNKCKMVMPTF